MLNTKKFSMFDGTLYPKTKRCPLYMVTLMALAKRQNFSNLFKRKCGVTRRGQQKIKCFDYWLSKSCV